MSNNALPGDRPEDWIVQSNGTSPDGPAAERNRRDEGGSDGRGDGGMPAAGTGTQAQTVSVAAAPDQDTGPDPTTQAYEELQRAFDHYNRELFDNEIPPCLITLQRKSKYRGYFSSKRFVHRDGDRYVDEIAMNPEFFASVPLLQILQTLVHEMVHAWQFNLGKPSRRSYHNKEWGDKMESIGLMPSNTGHPGGKRTGEQMMDYPIAGGPFMRATQSLLEGGMSVSWLDRFHHPKINLSGPVALDQKGSQPGESVESGVEAGEREGPAEHGDPRDLMEAPADNALLGGKIVVKKNPTRANRSNRQKFRCPWCAAQAWGKPGLKLLCGEPGCHQTALEIAV